MLEVKRLRGQPFMDQGGLHLHWWYCPECGATTFLTERAEEEQAAPPESEISLTGDEEDDLWQAIFTYCDLHEKNDGSVTGKAFEKLNENLKSAEQGINKIVEEAKARALKGFATWLAQKQEFPGFGDGAADNVVESYLKERKT
jgi:hypothetical protein